jgi:tetratricopeptide (TPR) repeat protein
MTRILQRQEFGEVDRRPIQMRILVAIAYLAIALIGNDVCQAQAPVKIDRQLEAAEHDLENGRSTLDLKTLLAARDSFQRCTRNEERNSVCYYDLARCEFYLGKAEVLKKDQGAADKWDDAAIADAQHAIALNDRSADAHALLSDLYGSKIHGMISGMHFGPKANTEIQRAFQLDPKCPQAFAAIGRKYLYSPSMFGGDIDKAIASFKSATDVDPSNDEAFVWLAIAYRKKGDSERARQALSEALRLNSRSVFAIRVNSGEAE